MSQDDSALQEHGDDKSSERPPRRAGRARLWWRDLQDSLQGGQPNPRADRASRARLRRATLDDAMTIEAVHVLYRKLWPPGFDDKRMRLTLRLALILTHVRADENEFVSGRRRRFGEAIGRQNRDDADSAPLKPLRFKRLLQARDDEDIIRQFRRAVAIAGNKVDVDDLADLLLEWERDSTRTRLAFDYFGAGAAAPAALPPSA